MSKGTSSFYSLFVSRCLASPNTPEIMICLRLSSLTEVITSTDKEALNVFLCSILILDVIIFSVHSTGVVRPGREAHH